MCPAEGSVAQEIVPLLVKMGSTGLQRMRKFLLVPNLKISGSLDPYACMPIVMNWTRSLLFFATQNCPIRLALPIRISAVKTQPMISSEHLAVCPEEGEPDRLLTVILDGENAWEWYRQDADGKEFLHALYRKLSALYDTKQIISVTMTEYMQGNPKRGVAPHPISSMRKLDWLYPGSWINANFDTWIGEEGQNRAWNYLLTARQDLEHSGLRQPDPKSSEPKVGNEGGLRVQSVARDVRC